jgi:hypothetical protein
MKIKPRNNDPLITSEDNSLQYNVMIAMRITNAYTYNNTRTKEISKSRLHDIQQKLFATN